MYVVGFVIPVAEQNMAAYKSWCENAAKLLIEYGCLEVMDTWEDNVPPGTQTDFRRAVQLKDGERVAFSWQKWPDKQSVTAVEKAMSEDPRFDPPGGVPFDQRRLIMGCFTPLSHQQSQ